MHAEPGSKLAALLDGALRGGQGPKEIARVIRAAGGLKFGTQRYVVEVIRRSLEHEQSRPTDGASVDLSSADLVARAVYLSGYCSSKGKRLYRDSPTGAPNSHPCSRVGEDYPERNWLFTTLEETGFRATALPPTASLVGGFAVPQNALFFGTPPERMGNIQRAFTTLDRRVLVPRRPFKIYRVAVQAIAAVAFAIASWVVFTSGLDSLIRGAESFLETPLGVSVVVFIGIDILLADVAVFLFARPFPVGFDAEGHRCVYVCERGVAVFSLSVFRYELLNDVTSMLIKPRQMFYFDSAKEFHRIESSEKQRYLEHHPMAPFIRRRSSDVLFLWLGVNDEPLFRTWTSERRGIVTSSRDELAQALEQVFGATPRLRNRLFRRHWFSIPAAMKGAWDLVAMDTAEAWGRWPGSQAESDLST